MAHAAAREAVVVACRRLVDEGLVVGTAGNVSVRSGDHVAISPSGVDYAVLAAADVPVVAHDATVVVEAGRPSTELALHLAAYRGESVEAVVHTHSRSAVAIGLVADVLPAVHYCLADLGGPVPVVPFAPPGSAELAGLVTDALSGRAAVLLRNHGALTTGPSLGRALDRAVVLEWVADVHQRALAAGTPAVLSGVQLDDVAARLAGYFGP